MLRFRIVLGQRRHNAAPPAPSSTSIGWGRFFATRRCEITVTEGRFSARLRQLAATGGRMTFGCPASSRDLLARLAASEALMSAPTSIGKKIPGVRRLPMPPTVVQPTCASPNFTG